MSKKLRHSVNTKSVEARLRKKEAKEYEKERKIKEIEDRKWIENDPKILSKQKKDEEKLKKQEEELKKRNERKLLLEKEEKELEQLNRHKAKQKPLTRTEIIERQEILKKAEEKKKRKEEAPIINEMPVEENLNRILDIERELIGSSYLPARSVEEGIKVLEFNTAEEDREIDRHPEKRVKAAFLAFQDEKLPEYKEDHPTLKLSQLKQLIRKEWSKSPLNPLNRAQNSEK